MTNSIIQRIILITTLLVGLAAPAVAQADKQWSSQKPNFEMRSHHGKVFKAGPQHSHGHKPIVPELDPGGAAGAAALLVCAAILFGQRRTARRHA